MHRIGDRIAPWIGVAVLVCCVFSMLSGCNDPERTAKKTTALTSEEQIRRIQEDPKMSPAAKEAAVRNIQYNQARSAAMAQSLNKK